MGGVAKTVGRTFSGENLKKVGSGIGKSLTGTATGAATGFLVAGPAGILPGAALGTAGGAVGAGLGKGFGESALFGAAGGAAGGLAAGLPALAAGAGTGGALGLTSATLGTGAAGTAAALGGATLLGAGALGAFRRRRGGDVVGPMGPAGGADRGALEGLTGDELLLNILGARQQELGTELTTRQEAAARELADQLAAERARFMESFRQRSLARRQKQLAALQGRLAEQSRLELPSTLEDLSRRGLLGSETAIATQLARQQQRNALEAQQFEAQQALADAAIEDQLAANILSAGLGERKSILEQRQELERDILSNRLGLELAGIKRRFSLQDIGSEQHLARQLAAQQKTASERQSLLGAGAEILGSILPRFF